jgi:hypothetical protein
MLFATPSSRVLARRRERRRSSSPTRGVSTRVFSLSTARWRLLFFARRSLSARRRALARAFRVFSVVVRTDNGWTPNHLDAKKLSNLSTNPKP